MSTKVFAADMTLQQMPGRSSEGHLVFFFVVLQYNNAVFRLQQSNKCNVQPDDCDQMSC